ncbi:antennal-enriched udp-glycosyltransferase [Stylonychia lemnae]|uniref:Antennal-enriched udp-glycosyltransferase n=1 Tax=Stylonychia lemnae TaxID=5949 RepID=A0A078AZ43_STYLE|nr:antennal-enriched udp-glycosyltransferase [Stylonychia lemnae]|eukprot:CDW86477.1 antennal-enriched udp-glycosyltransferase [Stylonychia lemnae]
MHTYNKSLLFRQLKGNQRTNQRKRFFQLGNTYQVIQDYGIKYLASSPYISKVMANGVIPIISKNLFQQQIEEFEDKLKQNALGESGVIEYMQFLTKAFYSQEELIREIKSINFDLVLCEIFFESQLIVNTLQIPLYIRLFTSNLDSSMQLMMKQQPQHSSQLHSMRAVIFGMENYSDLQSFTTSFFTRLRNRLAEHIFCGLGSYLIHQKLYKEIPEHLRQDAMTFRAPDMILYTGYEGLSQPMALSPNSRIIPPLTENESETQTISQDLQDFMENHQKLILVSFGTGLSPKSDTLKALSIYMQKQTDYGFIYSATNQQYLEKDTLERIKSLNNVYLAKWIPQIQILNNPKVKIFFNHGGQSSLKESIEAEKPLLIIPTLAVDQPFTCEYVQAQRLGACLYYPDVDHFDKQIKHIEENNGFSDRLMILKKMIDKKKQQGLGLLYWIDYLLEIGTSEFISAKQYQSFNYLQLYDVDVNIAIDLILIAMIASVIAILVKIYRLITCKKGKNESKSTKID